MVLTEQEKKERKRIYNKEYGKKYREKNKEKNIERKERKRIYNKEYGKKWREKNREKRKEDKRIYYKKNKEYILEYKENNPHVYVISCWKRRGLISDDYKALYDEFINVTHCQVCDKEFNKDIIIDRRCMDHDHETGKFRCFACNYCNLHNRMIK